MCEALLSQLCHLLLIKLTNALCSVFQMVYRSRATSHELPVQQSSGRRQMGSQVENILQLPLFTYKDASTTISPHEVAQVTFTVWVCNCLCF